MITDLIAETLAALAAYAAILTTIVVLGVAFTRFHDRRARAADPLGAADSVDALIAHAEAAVAAHPTRHTDEDGPLHTVPCDGVCGQETDLFVYCEHDRLLCPSCADDHGPSCFRMERVR